MILIFYVIKTTAHKHVAFSLCLFICQQVRRCYTNTSHLIEFTAKVDARTGNCGKIMMWKVHMQQFLQQTNIFKGRNATKGLFRGNKIINSERHSEMSSLYGCQKAEGEEGATVFYTTELRLAEHTRFYSTPTPRLTPVCFTPFCFNFPCQLNLFLICAPYFSI
jgi:hypothetical protein